MNVMDLYKKDVEAIAETMALVSDLLLDCGRVREENRSGIIRLAMSELDAARHKAQKLCEDPNACERWECEHNEGGTCYCDELEEKMIDPDDCEHYEFPDDAEVELHV